MNNDLGSLGITIRRLRTDKGLTQEGFAQKLGITAQAVSKWETGLGYPDITMLPAIADVLDVSMEELFGREPKTAAGGVQQGTKNGQVFEENGAASYSSGTDGSDNYQMPKHSFDSMLEGLPLVYVSDDTAVYSNLKPTNRGNRRVEFDDGSFVDLNTNTTTNFNHGRIKVAYDESAKRGRRWFGRARREEERNFSGGAIDSLDIHIGGQCDMTIHEGDEGSWRMEVNSTPEFFDGFNCSEQNGKLSITNSVRHFNGFSADTSIELWCGFRKGESLNIQVSGSSDTEVEPDFEETQIQISGSGDLKMADAGTCSCKIAGSGDVEMSYAHDFNAKIAGSGDITAQRIDGVSRVQIGGSGDLNVQHLSGSFEASVGGSGDISVGGGNLDSLSINFSGSGSFEGRELTVKDAEITLRGASEATIGRITGKSIEHIDRTSELYILNRG